MSEILKDDLREINDYTVYSKQTVFPFDIFGETGKGGRPENQDSFWFGDTSYGLLLIVCDGMGGGPGGRTASTLAVQEIGNYVNQHPNQKPRDVVIGSILHANKALYTYAKQHSELIGMGSTCVVALLTEEKAIVCHIGDSRFYQFRNHQLIFHTFDHSQVFEMVRNGVFTEEEARVSSFSNVITKGLGLSLDLKIDIHPDTTSDILEIPYRKGDRFVLCTDGIHGVLPMSTLTRELTKNGSIGGIAKETVEKIHQIGVNAGSLHDNLTILIASAKVDSQMSESRRPSRFISPKKTNHFNWKILLPLILSVIIFFMAIVIWNTERSNTEEVNLVTDSIQNDSTIAQPIEKKLDYKKEDEKNYKEIIRESHSKDSSSKIEMRPQPINKKRNKEILKKKEGQNVPNNSSKDRGSATEEQLQKPAKNGTEKKQPIL